eukprot:1140523-Pelagomonas_calceolata.AAC.2
MDTACRACATGTRAVAPRDGPPDWRLWEKTGGAGAHTARAAAAASRRPAAGRMARPLTWVWLIAHSVKGMHTNNSVHGWCILTSKLVTKGLNLVILLLLSGQDMACQSKQHHEILEL